MWRACGFGLCGRQARGIRFFNMQPHVSSSSMEHLKQFRGKTPLGRPGQPAELASIYVQPAASDPSFATGQIYGAAGGSGQP